MSRLLVQVEKYAAAQEKREEQWRATEVKRCVDDMVWALSPLQLSPWAWSCVVLFCL